MRRWSQPAALLLAGQVLVVAAAARAEDAAPPASTPAPAPSPVAAQGPIETIEVRGSSDEAAGLDTTAFATVIRAEDFADKVMARL